MKNCKSCGKTVSEDSKLCLSCGASVGEDQKTEEEMATSELRQEQIEEKPSKKLFKKKTLIITAVLAFIIITSAVAAIIHKSPKELYLLSEYKTYQNYKEEWTNKYGNSIEFQEKMMKQPSSSDMTLSGSVEMDSLGNNPDFEMIQELLSHISFTANTEQDPISKQGHYKLALNVEKENALEIEMFQSKDKLGLKVPELYEKFFYLNFVEYGEFMRMIDPLYEGPETLEVSDLKWQDLKLTEKEQKYIQKRYGLFLLDRLEGENFKVQKGVEYKHEGETMKLREVTLKLSASETKNLVNDFMDQLIEDNKLHSMIVNRAQKVAKANAMADDVEVLDTKEMKRQLINGLKDAKNEMKDISFPNGFSSTLLINKSEQVIDRKVTMAVGGNSDQVNMKVNSKNIPYGNDQIFEEFSVALSPEKDEDSQVMFQVTNDVAVNKDTRAENLKASFMYEEYGESEEIKFAMKSDINGENGGKQNIIRNFNLNFAGGDLSDMPSAFKGTIKQASDLNLKKDYSNRKFEVKLGLEGDLDSGTVTVKLDSKTKLKDKADLPDLELDSGEGLSVVNISENEMYKIQEEVGTNLMELGVKYGLIPEDRYQFDINDEASYDGYYQFEDKHSDDKF
ncbi:MULTISPECIES: DUF6583 family protein [unclassified Peribacillus]|uniref:DUF6583 family protein n=1 Tax=unclassified Peribacillus TaxID=2675266 RepID=UPI001913B12B|nr:MULTISPECIES: DUF6583 family protein [unclassified Peribacillus]MBK5444639.1 hypothetical protein [Peribacillus sp. TH24]MBK5460655.1 hypothetical protein [Peribacillus sp. TH27]